MKEFYWILLDFTGCGVAFSEGRRFGVIVFSSRGPKREVVSARQCSHCRNRQRLSLTLAFTLLFFRFFCLEEIR